MLDDYRRNILEQYVIMLGGSIAKHIKKACSQSNPDCTPSQEKINECRKIDLPRPVYEEPWVTDVPRRVLPPGPYPRRVVENTRYLISEKRTNESR